MTIIDLRPYNGQSVDYETLVTKLISEVRGVTKVIYETPDILILYPDQYDQIKGMELPFDLKIQLVEP